MKPIVLLGGVNVDLSMRTSRMPRPGESLEGHGFQMALGGKASNQAIGIARLGGNPLLISKVGSDDLADWIIGQLTFHGIDAGRIGHHGGLHSGVAMIIAAEDGENCIAVTPGAYGTLHREDIMRVEDALSGAFALMVALETPIETCMLALSLARSRGVITILDPGPVSSWKPDLLHLTDIVTPNETESAAITGIEVCDPTSWRLAGHRLLELGAGSVVMKLGNKGAFGVKGTDTVHVPAVPVEKVIDTTGAGDVFNAGFTVALARGFTFEEAMKFGVCSGGLAVTKPGAVPSMPEGPAVDQLYARLFRG